MRIGTWNLAGRWDARHLTLIEAMDCDVLLLTEVSERVELPEHDMHLGGLSMMPKRRWAAVASRLPLRPMPVPHGASAMAELEGLVVCASILPWRSCGTQDPWGRHRREEDHRRRRSGSPPAVWGEDWNHALSGRERAGSVAGPQSVLESVERLGPCLELGRTRPGVAAGEEDGGAGAFPNA